MTTVGTAKKKKDAKNLAFRLMASKLGEVLKLLRPQPGTQRKILNEQVAILILGVGQVLLLVLILISIQTRSMLCAGVRGAPPLPLQPAPAHQIIKAKMTQSSTYSSSAAPTAVAVALGAELPRQFGRASHSSTPTVVLPSPAPTTPIQCNPGKGFASTPPALGASPSPMVAPEPLPSYVPTFSPGTPTYFTTYY